MKKAAILDRDGTIIYDRVYLNKVEEIEYIPGTFEALRRLRDLGYVIAIATNQSGIARGIVDIKNLYAIHDRIREDCARQGVDIAGFYYAPYSVESNHYMRKPNPGMLQLAAREHGLDLRQSWMIGDRESDVEAGHAAGCRSILLTGDSRETPLTDAEGVFKDLLEASLWIESLTRRSHS